MATMDRWTRWLAHGESRREFVFIVLIVFFVFTSRTYRAHGIARPRLHATINTELVAVFAIVRSSTPASRRLP